MLQTEHPPKGNLVTYTYLVAVQADPAHLDPDQAGMKLADALSWVEGAGEIDVTFIGTMEDTPKDDDKIEDIPGALDPILDGE